MSRIGYYDTEGIARSVVVNSPYSYLADAYSGLAIIDVSNPATPIYANVHNTPGEANSIFIYDTLLYLADMSGGLRLFNLADPLDPIQISRDTLYGTYTSVVARDRYAFCGLGWSGFTVIDFTDLSDPEEYGPITSLGGYVYSIAMDGDHAYLACGDGDLKIVDISDPLSCNVIGSMALSGSARDVYARRDTVFVASYTEGLHVINACDPASPVLISSFDSDGYASGVWAGDTSIFLADYNYGLRAISIYDPEHPTEKGYYRSVHNCLNVSVSDGYIYACFGNDGLYILDGGLQLIAPSAIDSVWIWEDCSPEPSSVHVCYELIDPEGDESDVYARMSSDGGATWDVPFITLFDTEGNLGEGVSPGVNCFGWSMGTDLPNRDDELFTVEISTSSPSIREMTVPGTACPYWAGMPYGTQITDWWGGDTIPAVAPIRIDIDASVDSIVLTASGAVAYGDTYPSHDPNGGSPTPTIPEYGELSGISYFTDCPIAGLMAVFLAPGIPDSTATPPQLSAFTSNPMLQQSVYIGSGPVRLIPPEGANRLFLGVNDHYRWQDNTGSFDVTAKIFDINSYSHFRASDSLDSKPPELAIDCPEETLIVGTSREITWTKSDRSSMNEPAELAFSKSPYRETYSSSDNNFMWNVSSDFVPDCTLTVTVQDSFCNATTDTCLLAVAEAALPCTAWVDSVWFTEETDCDERNVIELCYNLSASCPDSEFYISIRTSNDSGSTWTIEMDSVYDEDGDMGLVYPGTHCFNWEVGYDYPGIEGGDWAFEIGVSVNYDTFLVIDSIDVSEHPNYGRGLAYGDGYYFIYDSDVGWIYQTTCIECPAVDSFWAGTDNNCDIDYEDGYIYYADSSEGDCKRIRRINTSTGSNQRITALPEYASDIEGVQVIGDSLIVAWLGIPPDEPNMLLYLDLTDPFPITSWETLFVSDIGECSDAEGMTFAHGSVWASNDSGRIIEIDLDTMAYVGCYPVPNEDEGAEGLCYDGEYMWYHNYHGTGTMQIYKIKLWDSFVNSTVGYGPADTRPPRIGIDCPDSILAGESYNITWSVEDLFYADNPCSVHVFGCGDERHHYVTGSSVSWMSPWECPACTIVVATRDSFCNWSSDTCVTRVYEPAPPCSVFIDSVWFAQEINCDGRNVVEICYDFHSACPDSGYFATVLGSTNGGTSWSVEVDSIFDGEGDIGSGTMPGVHCFNWEADYDFPGWEGDDFSIRIDVAGHGYNDYSIATGTLDTDVPEISIDCPVDTLEVGVPYNFTWSIGDDYYMGNPCSVTVQGCGIWERHEVEGVLFMWTAPWACSTYSIIVATRDSFCNWGADTCEFTVTGEEMPCSAYVDTLWFAQETDCDDSSIVHICYNLISSCPESTYAVTVIGSEDDGEMWDVELSTLYDYAGDIGDSIFTGEHCFYWNAGRDLPDWEGDFAIKLELLTDDFDSLLDQWFANNSVDTDPPTITLACPETPIFAGDTLIWSWTIDDMFPVEDYFEIYLNWCAGETTFVLDSAGYQWVVPPEAEGCNVQFTVAGRDSFCNWEADTCWTQIDTTSLRCKVLIYSNSTNDGAYNIREFDSLVSTLEAQGNEVTAYDASDDITITSALLANYSQFWFIDSKNSLDTTLSSSEVTAIRNYIEGGRGVAVLADHHPYYTRDADYLLSHFDIEVAGSENHRAGSLCNSEIDFSTHYITRGLYQLACFTSEGRIEYTGDGDFTPIATYGGDTLQAALIDGGRLFVDASFFRYLDTYIPQCDGITLAENIACWIEPNGCGCEIESCMVEVTASAEDSTICLDESAVLSTSVSGASGAVTFDWWSSPSGYTSTLQNPTFGPLSEDTWFYVRATDEAECVDIDSIFVDVLFDEVRDTFMCLGDTMTFCESPICDSGGITRGAVTVTHEGMPVYGSIIMDEDSSCMDFIPLNVGEFIVCHENFYDIENDCCYDVCWHVTVCCMPHAELMTEATGDCSWSFTLEDIPGSDCVWDSVAWTVESFYEQPVDTSIFENSLDLTIHGTDSVELCATASTGCVDSYYCSFSICTTLTCFNELCCTLEIETVDDTICYGETAYLCAILLGDDCPDIDTLPSEWTVDGNIVGTDFCVEDTPESTTTYCYNSSYENEFGDICVLSDCRTIHVVPQPPDIWPDVEYVPLGEALELPIPCGEFGDGYIPDSIVVLEEIIGAPAETVGVYSPGDWCVLRETYTEPVATVLCYDFFAEGCEWLSLECCSVITCDLPEAELTMPNGACPSDGEVTVCVHNLNTEISIDDILWSNGTETICTDIDVEPIMTTSGEFNSFAPETVSARICHECGGTMSCITETLIVEPTYNFFIDILPPGVTPGDSINTRPHIDPPPPTTVDSFIDWFIFDGDSMLPYGSTRYPDGIRGATSLYEKTIYCAKFDYDYGDSRCAIVACDSVFVQDSLLTVIKSPCATEPGAGPDPDGWMEVDGYRRYATCEFTFPVDRDCMTICASDTDFVMPTAYVFDHWETSAGIYSYASCTTYCPTSPYDTVYAVYDTLDMCVYFGSGTGEMDISIEEILVADDSVFSMDNLIEPRSFVLQNCGECSLDIALKWVDAENISDYDCPPVEISNSAILDYNEIGIRGRMTPDSLPEDFAIIRSDYTSVIEPAEIPFAPGDEMHLFIGIASPPDYHPCYPGDSEFQYRIALKLRWGIYLP